MKTFDTITPEYLKPADSTVVKQTLKPSAQPVSKKPIESKPAPRPQYRTPPPEPVKPGAPSAEPVVSKPLILESAMPSAPEFVPSTPAEQAAADIDVEPGGIIPFIQQRPLIVVGGVALVAAGLWYFLRR